MDYEPLAEVYRGKNINGVLIDPHLEGVHFGVIAAIDEQDNVLIARGDIHLKTYIRSAAKPVQFLPLLESGAVEHFQFTSKECAVICASHNGEPVHVEAVASILRKIGLDESYLQCGAHPPMHAASAETLLQQGQPFTALHNNCSGKHAGMLAACVRKGYPVESYLDFDHPLQLEILQHVERLSGAAGIFRGTDGCSAPVFYLEIAQMARIFAALTSRKNPLLDRCFSIFRAEPYLIGGDKRFDTDLMLNSEVIGKVGGEAVYCSGIPARNGQPAIGIAVKIADGNFRALYPVVTALLVKFGALSDSQIEKLAYYAQSPLKNHRKNQIGFIRAVDL